VTRVRPHIPGGSSEHAYSNIGSSFPEITLEYRIRRALQEQGATFPDQKGKRIPNPTARWVFHYFVGIHVLYIPGQGLMILNLTDEHQHLLQLLGKRYAWFYR